MDNQFTRNMRNPKKQWDDQQLEAECDVLVPEIFFLRGIGTSIEIFCTGIKSRNQYQKNLVPEKVSELVSKIIA